MMAKNTISQRITLEGSDDIKKALEGIGQAAEATFKKIAAAADNAIPGLGTKLTAAFAGLKTAFTDVANAGTRFGLSIKTFTTALGGFGNALNQSIVRIRNWAGAITLAAGGLLLAFRNFGQTSENIINQAEALGISTEAYERFTNAITDSGSPLPRPAMAQKMV
jgi:methyl-accepting chemotaxis protein